MRDEQDHPLFKWLIETLGEVAIVKVRSRAHVVTPNSISLRCVVKWMCRIRDFQPTALSTAR